MRFRIREIEEVKEDKQERSLPYFQDKINNELKEARDFWDNFFENVIVEEYQ